MRRLATIAIMLMAVTLLTGPGLASGAHGVARSQVDASGNILGALRTEVAALSGKGFTSEAVALVDVTGFSRSASKR
jgi:hypothetical protein